MSLPSEINPHLLVTSTGYNLTRSLRTRASASAYLNRTLGTPTNNKIMTWSGWVKRGTLGALQNVFGADRNEGTNYAYLYFAANDTLNFYDENGSSSMCSVGTTAVFRDPSAWYHIAVFIDTTQATASNRFKLSINGSQVTAFTTATYYTLNAPTIINGVGNFGRFGAISIVNSIERRFDGYLAEVNFIDGQALTPSSFGSFNATTGVWQPAPYTGSYGTNGFVLDFEDNSALTTSSNVGIGKDTSGNGNYWTTNNISLTAGVTYDSMTDVPTLTSATAANFCVMNPLDKTSAVTLTNGNLYYSVTSGSQCRASFGSPTSGLIYFEHKLTSAVTPSTPFIVGGCTNTKAITDLANEALALLFYADTTLWQLFKRVSGVVTTINVTGISYPDLGAVMQIAYDSTNGKAWLGKNNNWIDSSGGITGNPSTGTNPTFTFTSGQSFFPALLNAGAAYSGVLICGQQPFAFSPPTGFLSLNTFNLPDSTIVKGNTVMDATLYTGNSTARSITNSAGFKPDLVWVKSRSAATEHKESNSVRGATKTTKPNSTDPETTDVQGITSFNTNGFTVGTDTNYNNNLATYVAYQWQAGQGTTSSNTSGSITSTVSVNASAGCSILTFNGTGANTTVGHGLGVTPAMFLVKNLANAVGNWAIAHTSLTSFSGYAIHLNSTAAQFSAGTYWNSLAPTSSVVNLGSSSQINESAQPMMAQLWAAIAGFSNFGAYTGNGSADGTFVYTGFRPKVIWVKSRDGASGWRQYDTTRNPANLTNLFLQSSSSAAEQSSAGSIDILSNGFKLRDTDASVNGSASVYIYAAWAENPFKNALAR